MSETTSSRVFPFRLATISYCLALALIATMAIGADIAVNRLISQQGYTAKIVNIAGRQRMLSQRIGMLAAEVSQAQSGPILWALEAETAQHLDEMYYAIGELTESDATHKLAAASGISVASIYQSGDLPLADRVLDFVALGRTYLTLPAARRAASDELKSLLAESRKPLLDALEIAVARHQMQSERAIERTRGLLGIALFTLVATLLGEALFIFRPLFKRLREAQESLLEAAHSDPMTGCSNRRHFMEAAQIELHRAHRSKQPLATMLFDIDRFKSINDKMGHATGDTAIKALAERISAAIRVTDILGRLGGDEFALLLPNTDMKAAMKVAEKLRKDVTGTRIVDGQHSFHITTSIGVTVVHPSDDSIAAMLERADKALYMAKKAGRNRAHALPFQPVTPVQGKAEAVGAL